MRSSYKYLIIKLFFCLCLACFIPNLKIGYVSLFDPQADRVSWIIAGE